LEQPNGDLHLILFCAPIGIEYIQICKPWGTSPDWTAFYTGSSDPTIGIGISQGSLEDTILHARDRVQSMARAFAASVGVT